MNTPVQKIISPKQLGQRTRRNRADCVVKTPDYIYVFEFKLDKPIGDAMSQIDDKGYAIPYAADNRKLYKIGVVFSTEKRNVSDWKISADEA